MRTICLGMTLLTVTAGMQAQHVAAAGQSSVAEQRDVNELLARPVSMNVKAVPLSQAITTAAVNANVLIQYRSSLLQAYPKQVTLRVEKTPLKDVLSRILAGTPLRIVSDGAGQLSVTGEEGVDERIPVEGIVIGKVIDARTKRPLAGATVVVADTISEYATDREGSFRISLPVGDYRLIVRMVGYARQTRHVTVSEKQNAEVIFPLESNASVLDEVVVTGTMVATERKAIPNAITVITGKELEERGITRIDQLFRGDVPGVFAHNYGSGMTEPGRVLMASRGSTALGEIGGTAQPIKTYVDGVELADSRYIATIDPKSIERIEIITGPQASTVYGSNAINGVMQVFTKRTTQARPQFRLSLLSGFIQNNFSSALAPQHDHSINASSTEGNLSYDVGGSWLFEGAWTPAIRRSTGSGFGGFRYHTRWFDADVTFRRALATNWQRGNVAQLTDELRVTGVTRLSVEIDAESKTVVHTQGAGLRVHLTPWSWWSHTITVGTDNVESNRRTLRPTYSGPSDSILSRSTTEAGRLSYQWQNTALIPFGSSVRLSLTGGADQWRTKAATYYLSPRYAGGIYGDPNGTRSHNSGAFFQGQLDILESLFFTYGIRAEWHPDYGDDATPFLSPRYGVAYTWTMGPLTTKLRASYGQASRPPSQTAKLGSPEDNPASIDRFGPYDRTMSNAELGPENQKGGEGGIELFFGNRGSLVVTRYNQTVGDLIGYVQNVDSVRSLLPLTEIGLDPASYPYWTDGYAYARQGINGNIGGIRNQGWELQGSLNLGPLTVGGTYSWTKSRVMDVTEFYRKRVSTSLIVPGASFYDISEHTWAANATYAAGATSLRVNVQGVGQIKSESDMFYLMTWGSRILTYFDRMNVYGYESLVRGYALADISASRRLSPNVDAVFTVHNLADFYRSDHDVRYASVGRQSKFGLRARF